MPPDDHPETKRVFDSALWRHISTGFGCCHAKHREGPVRDYTALLSLLGLHMSPSTSTDGHSLMASRILALQALPLGYSLEQEIENFPGQPWTLLPIQRRSCADVSRKPCLGSNMFEIQTHRKRVVLRGCESGVFMTLSQNTWNVPSVIIRETSIHG